jgi:hexosaminidase
MSPMWPSKPAVAILVALVVGLAVPACGSPAHTAAGVPPVIPQPASELPAAGSPVTLTKDTTIVATGTARPVAAYLATLLRAATGRTIPIVGVQQGQKPTIMVSNDSDSLGTEGYSLSVGGGRIVLRAGTPHGLFNGVQTLRQLVTSSAVAPVRITDRPRFGYRGAMLDVARRFYPVPEVERFIDQIAQYKINTLHLHLTDDQGWRIAIGALPGLVTTGASTQSGWAPGTGGPWYYTAKDYERIVAYAKSRFVEVVPEIDGPGHTNAAQAAIPALNCDDKARPRYDGFKVGISLICTKDAEHRLATAAYLRAVIGVVGDLTPGGFIHIGGDETPQATAPEYAAYVRIAAAAVRRAGKRVIGWHQVGAAPLPPGSLVQYWGDDRDRATIGTGKEAPDIVEARKALAQHATFIMSPADHAYLDMKYSQATPYGVSWQGYTSVEKAYDWDPATTTLSRPGGSGPLLKEDQIAGVEAALWSDRTYTGSAAPPTTLSQFVDPSVYADYMAFPRLPAIAEIAWSPRSTHDWPSFRTRLAAQAPRWKSEGIGYYPSPEIWPP